MRSSLSPAVIECMQDTPPGVIVRLELMPVVPGCVVLV